MKKGVFMLFFMLFLIPLVNAQDIKIFGTDYPILLVVPIIFMALIVFIFLIIILKDAMSSIHLPKFRAIELKKHKEIKEIPEERINFIQKFEILKKKENHENLNMYFNEIINLIKEYLKNKYNIKNEFAFEEVSNMIKKVDWNESNLANKITKMKYSGVELKKEQIDEISNIFENIIRLHHQVKEFKKTGIFSFLSNLFKKKHKPEVKIVHEEKERKIGFFKKIFIHRKKNKILRLINESKKYIYSNPMKAKRNFGLAILEYHKLKVNEDKHIYHRLSEVAHELLKKHPQERHFFDVCKKIVALKHSGKSLSHDSIRAILTIKHLIKNEERLISMKMKEFQRRLETEKKKLTHFKPTNKITHHKEQKVVHREINNYELIQEKKNVLRLIETAHANLKVNENLAKRYYGESLLEYYKLPIKQEALLYSKIMRFHNEMVKHYGKKYNILFDISKELLKLKHSGDHLSVNAKELINEFNVQLRKDYHTNTKVRKKVILNLPKHVKIKQNKHHSLIKGKLSRQLEKEKQHLHKRLMRLERG